MLVKLMGIMDLLSAVAVIMLHYDFFITWRIGLIFAAYLILKGWLFRSDIASLLDLLCGIYLFIMLLGFTTFLSWVVAVYLFQKAVFSLA
jgi:hypothetical protein